MRAKGKKRKFKCRVDWQALKDAHKARPDNQCLKQWVDNLNQNFGDNWPQKKMKAAFHDAKMISPEGLFEIVPMSFPTTHVVDPDLFSGIAKYPVDQWLEQGAPDLNAMEQDCSQGHA